ncbi:UTRA domain-containing protein [Streptomyces sp. M2CJ-2]|nr:UTRA domain-containing protein [Streptomyces sp. M2CJ-2]
MASGPHRYSITSRAAAAPTRPADGRPATEDTGRGGTYARLAEPGYEPVHFREEIRSHMPSQDGAAQLSMSAGTPVILTCR